MGDLWSVCAVATQGEKLYGEWTTSYKLQFSSDGATYNIYKEKKYFQETQIKIALCNIHSVLLSKLELFDFIL